MPQEPPTPNTGKPHTALPAPAVPHVFTERGIGGGKTKRMNRKESRMLRYFRRRQTRIVLSILASPEAAHIIKGELARAARRGAASTSWPPTAASASSRLTRTAQEVLERALREALSLGHNYIGTEHILLAIARGNEGVAAQVLAEHGLTTDEIRTSLRRKP